MLGDISQVEKIYIKPGYMDMRKQLNGLVDLIQYEFNLNPFSNSLFLFCGRKADRIKAIHYEGDGFCLLYKRYENGRLQWPRSEKEVYELSHQQLRWLLERQIQLLKEQVDFLTRKLYGTKSEKTFAQRMHLLPKFLESPNQI